MRAVASGPGFVQRLTICLIPSPRTNLQTFILPFKPALYSGDRSPGVTRRTSNQTESRAPEP